MNGEIAQIAALALYGNEHLNGAGWTEFWPSANVFRYCKHVAFLDGPTVVAADPKAWFAHLKANNVLRLRLHHFAGKQAIGSDRELSAFVGGGGRWVIEALSARDSALWASGWRAGPKDERGAIWNVGYMLVERNRAHIETQTPALEALHIRSRETLSAISAFAKRQQLDHFAAAFDEAQTLLDSNTPLRAAWGGDFDHTTLVPLAAKQLLGAAAAAWVFGGMGSWNDQGFSNKADNEEYTCLSDSLWTHLCSAICAAVNASSLP